MIFLRLNSFHFENFDGQQSVWVVGKIPPNEEIEEMQDCNSVALLCKL